MDKSTVNEWLRFAQMDYETVQILEQAHPLQLHIICYHCQQCMEKSLKAYLAFRNQAISRTHSLRQLNQECEALDASFHQFAMECIQVNQYATITRYPYDAADEITRDDMIYAVNAMKKLYDIVREVIEIS